MSQRILCTRCRATFLAPQDLLSQTVNCPKCQHPNPIALPASSNNPKPSVSGTVSHGESQHSSRNRAAIFLFFGGALLGFGIAAVTVGTLLFIRQQDNKLVSQPKPVRVDEVEAVAQQFLTALQENDQARVRSLSTLELPPAIQDFHQVRRHPDRDHELRGSFRPLRIIHEQIEAKYQYDRSIDRFVNAHPLGTAANLMDQANAARSELDASKLMEKYSSGSPDEQLDAAVGYAELLSGVFQAALPRTELTPTYRQIIEDWESPIPFEAKNLALKLGDEPNRWRDLLGRPFHTLKSDGSFLLQEAEVTAEVRDSLRTADDPRGTLRLELVRFQLEGIDTGWTVVSASRESTPDIPIPSVERDRPRDYGR